MQKIYKHFSQLLLPILLGGAMSAAAQPWAKHMDINDKASFEAAKNEFKEYWKGKEPEKGKGFNVFNRWLYHQENHLMPDGSPAPAGINAEEYNAFLAANALSATGNWANMGPNNTAGGYAGLGRINCLAFASSNANIIYAGAAGGGIWKSTTGGTAWTAITDQQASLGVSSILVDPSNNNVIYWATGDADGRDSPSIGVLKSTDGGTTWAPTGLNWIRSELRYISKLQRHPTDPNTIYAATSVGIFKTTDAGATWTQSMNTVRFFDIENKPGDGNTYYATGWITPGTVGYLYRTTDGGATWTQIHSATNAYRAAVAVTPANANYVGLLYERYDNDGFNGYYASTNSGTSFSLLASSPNLLGWDSRGADTGGQGWYDLALAIDPTNASVIYVGGVNTWKSTNGGGSWKINTVWTTSGRTVVVHADKHALEFQNNTTLWQANDGGVYRTTNGGSAWTHLTNPMVISQMYRIGIAQTDASVIAGLQDNGTKVRSATGSWTDRLGGDGMDCAINPTNASIMFGELYYGDLRRSTSGGSTWSTITPTTAENTGWVTPFALAPSSPTTIYAGYSNIWKSTASGTGWTRMTSTNTLPVRAIAVAPNNANVVYYSVDAGLDGGSRFFRTTNGGTSWQTLTNPTILPGCRISAIAISNTNADYVWVTLSGYVAGQKVYSSTDGGLTWTNITDTLPNIPANCIVFSNNSSDGVYMGMDIGVYYRDASTGGWVLFNAGLPNVEVADIDIQYALGKVRIASYGRGVWESDLYGVTSLAGGRRGVEYSSEYLEKSTFSVSPNPATTDITVDFYTKEAGTVQLYIFDAAGRGGQKLKPINAKAGINTITVPVSQLHSGLFYIGDAKGKSTRFIKQ